ncbi:DMT family transporter [Oxalobacteraceae bacterium]|nr:DMT family transporter [Oxalobacteraceae bacterium]
MTHRLTPGTTALLTLAPLLWAGNVIVGRMVHEMVPPILFNFLRWAVALLILLPLAGPVFRRNSGLWQHWRRYALLGLLGVGLFNGFQYLALQTSTPINVTLVATGLPVWMMLTGRLFFGVPISPYQIAGATLSISGVLLVLVRGDLSHLNELRLVAGDIFMMLASIAWSFYSWLLMRTPEPAAIRANWASFLLAQVAFGTVWSGLFAAGEWAVSGARVEWNTTLALALLYVAVGPAVIAFRCWGVGVQQAGPGISAFFINFTPLFAAVMSSAFLGETPHGYHAFAFMLIVAGIVVSSRRRHP